MHLEYKLLALTTARTTGVLRSIKNAPVPVLGSLLEALNVPTSRFSEVNRVLVPGGITLYMSQGIARMRIAEQCILIPTPFEELAERLEPHFGFLVFELVREQRRRAIDIPLSSFIDALSYDTNRLK